MSKPLNHLGESRVRRRGIHATGVAGDAADISLPAAQVGLSSQRAQADSNLCIIGPPFNWPVKRD